MRCSGPETAKHRTSLGKSTDVLPQKYGCFASKVRMFSSKKSDVFVFRKGYSALTLHFILRFLAMAELEQAQFCSFGLTKTLDFILRFCRSAKSKQLTSSSSFATRHSPNKFGLCSRCSIGLPFALAQRNVGQTLDFGTFDADPCTFAHGYLISAIAKITKKLNTKQGIQPRFWVLNVYRTALYSEAQPIHATDSVVAVWHRAKPINSVVAMGGACPVKSKSPPVYEQ